MINRQLQEEKFRKIYDGLNAEQKLAVDTIEGPVMVIAGPGTGKTQILSARIGKILLETDAHPENILCLTYTEAGVVAMRKRLLSFIGSEAYKVQIHTFHSFSNMVIQENNLYFQRQEMEALSELERITFLQELIDGFDKDNPLKRFKTDAYYDTKNFTDLFSAIKKENWDVEELLVQIDEYIRDIIPETESFYYKNKKKEGITELTKKGKEEENRMLRLKEAIRIFPLYQDILAREKRYDFDDMINWVIRLFEEHPEVLLNYQEQFQYILVDEYQDTSGSQNKIAQLLVDFWQDEKPNIFVVGDDDQSIYKFQGANITNLKEFADKYGKDLQKVVLTKNYRSVQPVLDAAKNLIEYNQERLINIFPDLSKDLVASNEALRLLHLPPVLRIYENEFEEHAHIVLQIKKLIAQGVTPGEIAVIYRQHQIGNELIQFLQQEEIPYYARYSINLLDDVFIQNIIQIMRYVAAELETPFSGEHYLFEILHYDFLGISPFRIAQICNEIAGYRNKDSSEKSLRGYLQKLVSENAQKLFADTEENSRLIQVANMLEDLMTNVFSNSLQNWFEKMINQSGLLAYILQSPDKFWLMKKLTGLFDYLKDATHRNPVMSLGDFVEQIDLLKKNSLRINLPQFSGSDTGVNLLTAHGSKGLEFEYVFLMAARNDIWEGKRAQNAGFRIPPNVVAQETPQEKTEEIRRLFYVAMTRTKKQLYISYPENSNAGKLLQPSQFITEIHKQDNDLIVEKVKLTEADRLHFAALRFGLIKQPRLEEMNKAFIDRLLEHFTMNVSALNNYLECPLKFFYTTLIRVPAAKSEAAAFGTAVHRALSDFINTMMQDGNVYPSKDYLVNRFKMHLQNSREVFTKESLSRYMVHGMQVLEKYYTHYYVPPPVNDFIKTEYPLTNVMIGDVPVKGFADKIQFWNKDIVITDFKTGAYAKAKTRGEFDLPGSSKAPMGGNYWRQAVFYKLLAERLPGKDWHVQHIEFDFVEATDKDTFERKRLDITPEEMEQVTGQITDVWRKIQRHDFYTGCGKPDCDWCNFVRNQKIYEGLRVEDPDNEADNMV